MKINNQSAILIPKADIKGKAEKNTPGNTDMVTLGSGENTPEFLMKPLASQTSSEADAYKKGCTGLIGGGALIGGGYVGGFFAGTIVGFKLGGITGAATGACVGSIVFGKIGTFLAEQLVKSM